MKKLTAILLACCFVLCGCSNKAPAPESTPEQPSETTETATAAVTETAAETTEAPTEPPAQDTEIAYWHHPDLSLEEALSCYLEPDSWETYYSMCLPSSAMEAWQYDTALYYVRVVIHAFSDYEEGVTDTFVTEQFGMTMKEFINLAPDEEKAKVHSWAEAADPHTMTGEQYMIYFEWYLTESEEAKKQEASRLRGMDPKDMSESDLFGYITLINEIVPEGMTQQEYLPIILQVAERCREIIANPEYAESIQDNLPEKQSSTLLCELDAANTAEWYAAYAEEMREKFAKDNRSCCIPEKVEYVAAKLLLNTESYYYDVDFPSWWEMPDDLPYLPEVTEVRYLVLENAESASELPELLQNKELFACYVPGDGWLFHWYSPHSDDSFDPASNSEKRVAEEFFHCAIGALARLGADDKPGCYSSEPGFSINPYAEFNNTMFVDFLKEEFPALDDYRYIIVVDEMNAHVAIQRKNAAQTPCIGFARWEGETRTLYSEDCTDASFLFRILDDYPYIGYAHALDFEAACDAIMDNYGFLF